MNTETFQNLKRQNNGTILVVFFIDFEKTVNRPSHTPYGAWALVETDNEVIILKESRSTSKRYAMQDIGYAVHSPQYSQHYDVSNEQYDDLFGKGLWEKKWMEDDEFKNWQGERKLTVDEDAELRQSASWRSTGHR